MLTANPTLQNFSELVPYCPHTARLDTVRAMFQRNQCDRIAVVNEQRQPLGLIYLRRLMFLSPASSHLEKPWQESLANWPSLLTPLVCVSATLSLSEFWTYLQDRSWQEQLKRQENRSTFNDFATHPESPSASKSLHPDNSSCSAANALLFSSSQTPIALIHPTSGQLIGLLDPLYLLRFLAVNTNLNPLPSDRGVWETPWQAPEGGTERYNEPLRPAATSSRRTDVVRDADHQPLETLSFLVQFLEQLPLPLRLQTPDGQILSQNSVWLSRIGTGPEPTQPETTQASVEIPGKSCNSTPSHWYYSTFESKDADPGTRTSSMGRRSATLAVEDKGVSPCIFSTPCTLGPPFPPAAPSWCKLQQQPNTYVCMNPLQKGQERIWQFIQQPLGKELILVLGQDVTEEHLVAKELATKNADLIQLNRLKDEFLACISHELKTPLTAVLGLSSLLKEQVMGELNDRQLRYAKLIHQSGRHLMTVVNDILDLTRMETGQLELILEPVQIATVCDRAFDQAQQLQQTEEPSPSRSNPEATPPSCIDFTLEIEPGLTQLVADEVRLRQMLLNLLSNALKFTAPEGKIGLKVSRWEGWIAFTVWDTGIGIPIDKQHLLFQKFQQLESPLTRRFQGTGLGLVLTQRLAHLHGGDVSFISSEGQGSQFTLLLPPCPPGKTELEEMAEETLGSHQLTESLSPSLHYPQSPIRARSRLVLIVEAVPRFIEALSNQLTDLGYRVLIARSGTEALDKARRFNPEVIFLNPLLPLLSGWDLLTLLKTDADTCSIPVIVTATRGEKERAARQQADGFLSLPIREPALKHLLSQLTRQPESNSKAKKQCLVILWISPLNSTTHPSSCLLHLSDCRVLEADDLDQAALLARIWQPDLILLDSLSLLDNPLAWVEQLSQCKGLENVPLVTLDAETTQFANQVKGLSVFPCLATDIRDVAETSDEARASALWQVIQVAAGMSWKPSILLIDISQLADFPSPSEAGVRGLLSLGDLEDEELSFRNSLGMTSQLPVPLPNSRALIQYLQTAGFRGSIGRSWTDVLQHLQYQSADVVLICVRDASGLPLSESSRAAIAQFLANWEQITTKPPVLVLDSRSQLDGESEREIAALRAIATQVLSSSTSFAELLEQIEQTLKTIKN